MGQPVADRDIDSRLNYRAIFEAVGEACLVLDPKFTVVAANSAYRRLVGQPALEFRGRSFFELFPHTTPSDLVTRVRKSLALVAKTKCSHSLWTDLYPSVHREEDGRQDSWKLLNSPIFDEDGEVAWLIHLVRKCRTVWESESASERPEDDENLARIRSRVLGLDSELLHHSRYDMVGLAASTIAHELNQPLTAATNYMRASRRFMGIQPPQPGRAGELLDKALNEMKSVSEAIRPLRGVVDKREAVRELEDLNSLVNETVSASLESSRDSDIVIEAKLETGLPLVLMDRIHIGQVLLNLLRNAIDAVKDAPRKQVSIVTEASAGFVQVTVADSGPGVKEDLRERLFQPFVGTKEQGLGLGLAICKAIIDAHGGEIWCEDRSPTGATFGFRIPENGKKAHD